MPGEADDPVSAARSGWATDAELYPVLLGKSANRLFEASPAATRRLRKRRSNPPAARGLPGVSSFAALSSGWSGRWRPESAALSASSANVLGRSFSSGMARCSSRSRSVSESGRPRIALEPLGDERDQPVIVGSANIVAVEAVELGEVEAGRGAADGVDVEPLDRLLGREDLVVAVAPAEAQQIVAQRLGQIAQLAIGIDAERAVPFRQLGAVGAVDQRDMGEFGDRPAERVIDLRLAEGVVEVVVAADHMGDPHVVVVDHDREIVGRGAVRPQDDQIVEFAYSRP